MPPTTRAQKNAIAAEGNGSKGTTSSKKRKLEVPTEVGEDGFGLNTSSIEFTYYGSVKCVRLDGNGTGVETDHFSRLPKLCHLAVFKHLERKDIKNASMANTTLRPLADDASLDSIKFGGDWEHLVLKQTPDGYGFDYKLDRRTYHYEIVKSDSGALVEKKTVTIEKKSVKKACIGETAPAVTEPHDWTVPDEYFDALAEIGKHHGITQIKMEKMKMARIDNPSNDNGSWSISIDRPISSGLLTALQTNDFKFSTLTQYDGSPSYHIKRKRDLLCASILYNAKPVYEGRDTMHTLKIRFYKEREPYAWCGTGKVRRR